MRKLVETTLLILFSCNANAQLGVCNIGNTQIKRDSLGYSNPGKASTPKCARPGPCGRACTVYTFMGSGNWNIEDNWEAGIIPPSVLTGCFEIVINPAGDGECLLNIPMQLMPPASSIYVMEGKKLRIPGSVIIQ